MHRLKVSLLCLLSITLAGSVFGQTAPQPDAGGTAVYDSSSSGGVSSYNSYSGGATYGGNAGAYFNARYFSGNGVGYQQGYQQYGGFVPFWLSDDVVIGPDMRLLIANTGGVGGNLGGIGRKYFAGADRILGAAAYFDMDQSSNRNTYQQGTFGLETLGERWDLRGNVYYTGNNQDKFVGTGSALCVSGNPFFSGNNIVFQGQQGQYREQAMGGADIEIGAPIFQSTPWLRGYVGAYYYKANQVQPPMSVNIANQTNANPVGFRGHLDAWIADDLLIGVNVTTDPVWGTNVNGMVDFRFSGFKPTRYFPQWNTRERMLAPWQRNWRIAVEQYQTATNTDVVAINPVTGKPYFVSFVNGDNTDAGTGTFEDPFKSFNHPNGIAGADIIYVARDGSTAANPYIGTMKLLDNQILLGEGGTMTPLPLAATYGNCTVAGNFTLPGIDGSGNYPWVSSPGGHAIGLANNNEVSGFHIINSVDGILGTNINDANLRNLDIHNNSGRGINLTNVGGTVSYLDVNSSNNGTGIFMSETGKTLTSTFTSVTTNNNTGNGLQVVGTGGSVTLDATDPTKPLIASGNGTDNANVNMTGGTFLGNFTGATFTNSVGGSGFGYSQAGGTGTLNLTNSLLNTNGIDGLNLAASAAGSIAATTAGSQLNGNTRDGIHSVATGASTITTNDNGSTMNQNGRDGYFYDLSGNSVLNATFLNDSLVSNTRSAFFGMMNASTANLNLTNVLATNSGQNGFALDATAGSIFNATTNNANFSTSGANGISTTLHALSSATFNMTGTTDNGNIQNGVSFLADNSAYSMTAVSSTFNNNSMNGVVGTAQAGSTAVLDLSNASSISGNVQNGVFVTTTGLSNVNASFANTAIDNNSGGAGVRLSMDNSPNSSLAMSGTTTLNNNGTNGLQVDATTNTIFTPTLVGTTIQGNGQNGVLLNASSGSKIGTIGTPGAITNSIIQNNGTNGLETNATGASSLINILVNNSDINNTTGTQQIGYQFDATAGGQVITSFINGSTLNNNTQNAVNGNVSGAGSIATVTLDGTNASNSGSDNAAMTASAGGVLNFTAMNGASFDNSVNGGGVIVGVNGVNSVANIELNDITADGNQTVGFSASAMDAVAPGVGQQGATLNVCLQTSSFSNNTLQGLTINVAGPGAVAYYGVGTTTAGTGNTVNGNGQQGLLTQTTGGGELDYRSINTTYDNNGTGATKFDGVDMRVDGTGSKLRTLFSGGTANGNGRDGLHFGGLTDGGSTNGADITVSLSDGTTASGNGRYSLNFDANGANTANLVEDPSNPPILVGPINLNFSNIGTAVVNLAGEYHFDNSASNGLAINFANTTTAFFSLDGQGVSTADNNALDGISVDMTNVTNGSIFIGGFSSISGNGGNGIHVGMTNVANGALGLQGIAGGTTMTGNGANGIDVQLNTVNLVNNFSSTVVSPNVIGLTTTDNQSYNACLPLPVVLPVNTGVIVPTTGLTIDSFNVATSGAGGIIVDGTATTIATGGAITNNTVSGSLGGDGIQLSLHNAALVNPTADGFVLTGNSSTGNTGNGINIDLLNATMNNLNMSGTTTVNNNTGDGLHINLVNSSMTPTTDLDSLLASGNGGNGVSISAATNSNIFIDFVSLTANNNGAAGFAGSALSGSTLNVCLDAGSVSTNGTQGLNLNVDGAGSIANLNLGPVATLTGPGVTVNGNTDQGLLASVTNSGVLNYRSINSTYDNNGTTTANDGVDMRVNGAGSTIDTLFYGGSANGNGRDGYHFGGLTDAGSTAGATLTVSLSGVTSTGNTRNALNFDPLNAANANLLMDATRPSTITGPVAGINDASTVTNEVVLNLEGLSFANGLNLTFDNAVTGIDYAYVSLDGQGTSTIDDGLAITMNGLISGSVRLVDYASVTNVAGDAIAVTMDGSTSAAGHMDGAIEIQGVAGQTVVNTTNGSGVNISLNDTNLVNGLTAPSINIQVLTTTSNLASPLNCLPLPTNLLFAGIAPANGLTIANLNITGTTGVDGISVVGTNSTIAATGGSNTGGTITNNNVGGTFSGDGINVSMTNTGATAAMMNGLNVSNNTVGGTIVGDGIRVQDLNTGATGSAANDITIGSNTVTGVTGNGIEFVATNPTASVSTVNNLQIINNTVKASGGNALAVTLNNATSDIFSTSGNSLDTSTLNGFALNLNNSTLTSWTSTGGDITGNTQNGLVVTNSNTSSILSGLFTNWAINSNGADGVKFTTSDATKSIFGDKANAKNITFTGGSISNNGTTVAGNGVNLGTVANGTVANLVFTNETIGNTAIGGTQQNGLIYNIAATGATVDALFTGGSINNNAVDAINGTINGTGVAGISESTITLNGTAANGSGSTGALFAVNNAGALTLIVQDNAGTGSTINNSGADGISITATGVNTVATATVTNSSIMNNGRTVAGNGITFNLDDGANSTLPTTTNSLAVTGSTIGNTALVGGTQQNGVAINLNQTLIGLGTANMFANFENSTISNNQFDGIQANVIGAQATQITATPYAQAASGLHLTLDNTQVATNGLEGLSFAVNGGTNPALGGVVELTSLNGTSISGNHHNGILLIEHDTNSLVAMSMENTLVNNNGSNTFTGDGLNATVTGGARFNLAASANAGVMSFNGNQGDGIDIIASDAASRVDVDLFTVNVNTNSFNGLTFQAFDSAAVNVRAYDTTFDTNGLAGLTGNVSQTAVGATGTSGIVNIIGGSANNNGTSVPGNVLGSGYSLNGVNTTGNAATLTGQFQADQDGNAVSATGNQGYGINFVASGMGTQGNLLMSGNTILSGNTLGAVNISMTALDQAIIKLSGTFDNNVGDGIAVTLQNVNLGIVAITGGEVNNNGGNGINIDLENVAKGGVLIGGLTSVSGNGTANGAGGLGQDGIHVVMNNVGTGLAGNVGALTIDGQNGDPGNVMNVSNNTGNGVSVAITGTSVIDNATFNMVATNANVISYDPNLGVGFPGTSPNPVVAPVPDPLPNPLLNVGLQPIPGITFSNSTEITGLTMDNNGNSTGAIKTGNGILFAVDGTTGATVTGPILVSNNTITNTGSTSTTSTHAGVNLQLTNGANVTGMDLVENTITGTKGDGFQLLLPTYTTPGSPLALNFTRDSITNNTLNGVNISLPSLTTPAPALDLTFTNDTISSNGANGVLLGLADNPNSKAVANVSVLSDSTTANPVSGKFANDFSNNTGMGLFITALNVTDTPPLSANQADLTLIIGGNGAVNTFNANGDAGVGISLNGLSTGTATVSNASFTNTVARGLAGSHFSGDGFSVFLNNSASFTNSTFGDATLTNTTFSNNAGSGLRVETSLSGNVDTMMIQHTTVAGNGGNGLNFRRNAGVPVPGPYVTNVSIMNNNITQNLNGVSISAEFADGADTYTINNNVISNNRANGVALATVADADLTANFDTNTISSNGQDGIHASQNLGGTDLSVITSTIINSTLTNNGDDGIDFTATHALVIGTLAAPNLISGNLGDGINIIGTSEQQSGGIPVQFTDQIVGNAILNNGQNGINITVSGQGLVLPQGSFETVNIDSNNRFSTAPGGIFGGINGNGADGIRLTDIGGKLTAVVNNNDVLNSVGDGVQVLTSTNQVNNVTITSNDIDTSGGRGINVLNAANSATNLQIDSNIVARSFLEGIYIVNTSTNGQLGNSTASVQGVDALANAAMAIDNTWLNDPELALTMHSNTITSNGQAANGGILYEASGLVIRVGSSGASNSYTDAGGFASNYSSGTLTDATVVSVGNMTRGGVAANIFDNAFTGQFNADVTFQAFTSTTAPPTTAGAWTDQNQGDSAATPPVPRNPADDVFRVDSFTSDPLSRLDLRFTTTNTGESAIVTRTDFFSGGNGVYNNAEGTFKSRTTSVDGNDPPVGGNNASNVQNGDDGGPFNSATRDRNITRQASIDAPFNTPTGVTSNNLPAGPPNQINVSVNGFLYSGTGASTFRRTADSSTNGFNTIPAGSAFGSQVLDPQNQFGAQSFRWDAF
jgi:hypothetical protein